MVCTPSPERGADDIFLLSCSTFPIPFAFIVRELVMVY